MSSETRPTCDYCGSTLESTDELPNLHLQEMHESQGWERYFCCPDHLLAWVHSDPPQLEPHVSTG